MTESKSFSTASILSLYTGISFCGMSEMHEAAEYLMGHPIWTHHFADKKLWNAMKAKLAPQCPGMPDDIDGVTKDNYLEYLAKVETLLGKTIIISHGNGSTAKSPLEGIPDHLKNNVILTISHKSQTTEKEE